MNKKIKLLEKLDIELQAFKENLMKYTKEEIMFRSYEIAIKNEMRDMFEDRDLDSEELDTLLQGDNILDSCFNEWIHEDSNLQEMFEYTLDRTIEDYKYLSKKDKER